MRHLSTPVVLTLGMLLLWNRTKVPIATEPPKELGRLDSITVVSSDTVHIMSVSDNIIKTDNVTLECDTSTLEDYQLYNDVGTCKELYTYKDGHSSLGYQGAIVLIKEEGD